MNTVKMIKKGKYADIANNPQSIRQAQLEGWSLCESEPVAPSKDESAVVESMVEESNEPKRRYNKKN